MNDIPSEDGGNKLSSVLEEYRTLRDLDQVSVPDELWCLDSLFGE
jgi:hypothetical protein